MWYRLCADILLALHLAFVLFAVLGALLTLRWRKVVWFHVPAVIIAATAAFAGWICPLTPMENWFRIRGGGTGYSTTFIDHYITPILYPVNLTRGMQIALGIFVIALNALIYLILIRLVRGQTTNHEP